MFIGEKLNRSCVKEEGEEDKRTPNHSLCHHPSPTPNSRLKMERVKRWGRLMKREHTRTLVVGDRDDSSLLTSYKGHVAFHFWNSVSIDILRVWLHTSPIKVEVGFLRRGWSI
ncbi:hypothetical protein CASFOL_028559 [Castilleja foliolosa]|uniref:Uncharacterized protein n=1 Tax=Castilleja foliolosa TaxID=1961234 RepID=A0ABD3CCZ3_9LAMI